MVELSIGQARRLALGAQGFAEKRPAGRVDRRHLRRTMDRLQLIQLDSVPVVVRTQYLPLFSRLGPYRPEQLNEIAYSHDEWFEAWAHEASLLPVEAEPLLRWHKRRSSEGDTWSGLYRLACEEPAYVESVLDEISDRGPLLTSELSDPRPRAGEWWGSRSLGQLAVDWLFRIGAIGVRRSPGFEKSFDLIERIVPAEILAERTPTDVDAMKELICRSSKAHGVGTANDIVDYFRLPIKEAKALIPELVEDGRLLPASVEGWDKPAFLHPEAVLPRQVRARALLSPFDPVCWYRDRALRLFDFHYRLEIYVPKKKRVYGYYVLPFLMGDRLAGRFDLKTHRDRGVLEVVGSYCEDGEDPGEVAPAAAQELLALATLVGVDSVSVNKRGNLSGPLNAALKRLT
ncbi:MAG: winged helix-turn-helix domain-containing protein [Acidimicrobiales bacterium]